MKLTLEFIYTKLSLDGIKVKRRFYKNTVPTLMCVGILGDGFDPKVEILYIDIATRTKDNIWLKMYDGKRASLITTYSKEEHFSDCDLILVPDDTDMLALMQDLSMLFIKLNSWADSVAQALACGSGLQTIVNLTVPIVGNPLYFCDTSFQQIAVWGGEMGYTSPIWKYQITYHYLPYTTMQNLIDTGDLTKIFGQSKAWIVKESEAFGTPFVCKSLYQNGRHLGNLFFIQYYKKLNYCDIEIAEYLGNLVAQAVIGNRSYIEASPLYNSHFIKELIDGKKVDSQVLIDYLKALRWNKDDVYVVAILAVKKEKEAIKHHIMALISSQLNAQCLEYDGNVVAIINISSSSIDAALKPLKSICKTFKCNLSLSEDFDDFEQISQFNRQAKVGLEMIKDNSVSNTILYSSIFLDDANKILAENIPISRLANALDRFDKLHHASLCETLLNWLLNDKNSSKTSDEMFIHRNTLLKRLARIEEVLDISLEAFDDCHLKARTIYSLMRIKNIEEHDA